ncbi:Spo0E family sporulation regulatory protein-aspartic acid phosphatase [Rossellomorea vietnamensis]|uniref:Aspartyl-phosphate phosphatase Spo0E family protein n=1 Tax=Rossellomorea aquimaris TaxID=189382 RepID=A0A5D4U831_9BACI|nr:aspartyl-phosphate phosphatase Spo0E family protein [Rossellomorea aquimaris]TYS83432.1 aspartyl-phosphate phosphatase Spo0E family protein [Rossellomorea aquimaris]
MITTRDTASEKVILHKISIKQKTMLRIGARYGLNDYRTVRISQELDKLITKYQELNIIKSAECPQR